MAATNSNRIAQELTEAQIIALRDAFATIESILPFLIGLTNAERLALPKISASNKIFTEDAATGFTNNVNIFPAYVKPEELNKDYKLFNQLDEFVQRAAKLSEMLSDTQMLAGSEAYVSALMVYRLAESAANAGVPGADTLYAQLKERFTQAPKPEVAKPATVEEEV